MDAFERLKQKNEQHSKLVKKESGEVFPSVLSSALAAVLFYYEFYVNLGSEFGAQALITLFLVYVVYSFTVFMFCDEFTKNSHLKNSLLIICHSTYIYLWIWQDNKWAVAYLIGLLFVSAKVLLMLRVMKEQKQ